MIDFIRDKSRAYNDAEANLLRLFVVRYLCAPAFNFNLKSDERRRLFRRFSRTVYAKFSRKWGDRHNNARNISLIYPFPNVNIQQYRKFHSPPSVNYQSPPGLIQRANRYMVEP